ALGIPDPRALAARQGDGVAGVVADNVLAEEVDDRFGGMGGGHGVPVALVKPFRVVRDASQKRPSPDAAGKRREPGSFADTETDSRVISVPTPLSVKISRRSECLSRPSMMCVLPTPRRRLSRHASTFGIIPLSMTPSAISRRQPSAVRLSITDPGAARSPRV